MGAEGLNILQLLFSSVACGHESVSRPRPEPQLLFLIDLLLLLYPPFFFLPPAFPFYGADTNNASPTRLGPAVRFSLVKDAVYRSERLLFLGEVTQRVGLRRTVVLVLVRVCSKPPSHRPVATESRRDSPALTTAF